MNERLDEILDIHDNLVLLRKAATDETDELREATKQAITSLIKELVAEAKSERLKESDYVLNMGVPHNPPSDTTRTNLYRKGYNDSLDQYEQNLLKALEEL